MPSQDPARRLRDILGHISLLRAWTDGMSLEPFADETRTRYAVQMALMVMGEAAEALPPESTSANRTSTGGTLRHRQYLPTPVLGG